MNPHREVHNFVSANSSRYLNKAECLRDTVAILPSVSVAAFVLFTPQQTYERAVYDYKLWAKGAYIKGSYYNLRSKYIGMLPYHNPLKRLRRENTRDWISRLARIKGLARVKASFLACLLEPLCEDVEVCLDVWMYRYLGIPQIRMGIKKREAEWYGAQFLIKQRAKRLGLTPFIFQWAAWDYLRSAGKGKQIPLLVKETNIAEDLVA